MHISLKGFSTLHLATNRTSKQSNQLEKRIMDRPYKFIAIISGCNCSGEEERRLRLRLGLLATTLAVFADLLRSALRSLAHFGFGRFAQSQLKVDNENEDNDDDADDVHM